MTSAFLKRPGLVLMVLLVYSASLGAQVSFWKEQAQTLHDSAFEALIIKQGKQLEDSALYHAINKFKSDSNLNAAQLYHKLKNFQGFASVPSGTLYQREFVVLEAKRASYVVYIPQNYRPNSASSVLIYLRGGWLSRKAIPGNAAKEIVLENPFFEKLDQAQHIFVYPLLDQSLAIYGRYGYYHLNALVRDLKSLFNVDDNRVYLAGYSDGGRTAYNMAYLRPTDYAEFCVINGIFNSPFVAFPNFALRPISTFYGKQDSLASPQLAFTIASAARTYGGAWKFYPFKGGHDVRPYQDSLVSALLSRLKRACRNPYPSQITYHKNFEYPALNGLDWLDVFIDPDGTKKAWHQDTSILISYKNDQLDTIHYGNDYAQVRARYANNEFKIEASMVHEVKLKISPEMVDLDRKVQVWINGQKVFDSIVEIDPVFLMNSFEKKLDRKQLWVQEFNFKIS